MSVPDVNLDHPALTEKLGVPLNRAVTLIRNLLGLKPEAPAPDVPVFEIRYQVRATDPEWTTRHLEADFGHYLVKQIRDAGYSPTSVTAKTWVECIVPFERCWVMRADTTNIRKLYDWETEPQPQMHANGRRVGVAETLGGRSV